MSIEAGSIRIGNWFEHNTEWNYAGHNGLFQWEDRDWYALGESTLCLRNASPVTLTEDWLLNFGFEKNERHVHEMHPWIDYTLKGIRIQLPYFTFNFGDEDEQDVDIQFIHQLQNLYHSLTGNELTLSKPF